MKYIEMFQINIFAIFMLFIMGYVILKRHKVMSYGKHILLWAILATIIALIIEPLTWYFDGKQFFGAYFLEYFTNVISYLLGPIIASILISYVKYILCNKQASLKEILSFLPIIITVIMLLINLIYPVYFSLTETNNYLPESYDWIHNVVLLFTYLYLIVFTLINRKKTNNQTILLILVFLGLPIFGMAIKILHNRLFFSWTSIAFSIFVMVAFMETSDSEKDMMTELFNRESYRKHINFLINKGAQFSIIAFDLDKFKDINDTYGHLVGDQILIEFSNILVKTFDQSKMIARLGGDEFIVVIDSQSYEESISQLKEYLKKSTIAQISNLSFSYGFVVHKANMTADDLYNQADKNMYEFKKKNNSLKRRQSDN